MNVLHACFSILVHHVSMPFESPTHIFMHCPYAFLGITVEAFCWSWTCPNNIFGLPMSLLVVLKRWFSWQPTQAFFWTLWGQANDN